jgi:hypothetical protein
MIGDKMECWGKRGKRSLVKVFDWKVEDQIEGGEWEWELLEMGRVTSLINNLF